MAKKMKMPDLMCAEPMSLDKQFKAGANISEGVSGRAPLDTDRYDYKADRRISTSACDEERQEGE